MEKISQPAVEKTFVLAHPEHHMWRSVGNIVTEFEIMNLNVTELRCMNVSKDFARQHLANIGWGADAQDDAIPFGHWDYHLTSRPVTAMIVEGKGCFRQVKKLISQQKFPFWINDKLAVYTSGSKDQAEKDFGQWFCLNKVVSERVVCVLPGEVHGPVNQIEDFWHRDPFCNAKKNFRDNFYLEDMCFFFIKPLAFRKRCVGELLHAIEAISFSIKGLKLVKKADFPSKAWPPADSDEDEYGVAVVASHVGSNLIITHENPYMKPINHDGVFKIGSNYVHQGEPGKEVLEDATEFFESGLTVWVYPHSIGLSGCMFEASLVGLASM
ncbi:hypothetical protein MKW94_012761 [Papaver nudicaule]|uniref:nucleoside-diphosphate kinase n=1 Tax=Papaver nudicaule TaxID=74823 RepID=A0AA42AUU0_PAPNU|nr:hypothetical protein [Papaver nudicaule]